MKVKKQGVLVELDRTKKYVMILRHDSSLRPEDIVMGNGCIFMVNDVDRDIRFVEFTGKEVVLIKKDLK